MEFMLTSYSRSTASPEPIRPWPGTAFGPAGPSLRQLAPRGLSGQSLAICPALPQTRQIMLAVKLRCWGQSYFLWPISPQF